MARKKRGSLEKLLLILLLVAAGLVVLFLAVPVLNGRTLPNGREAAQLFKPLAESGEHYLREAEASAANFEAGRKMFENNELDSAQLLLEQVDENDPNYLSAKKLILDIKSSRAAAYLSAARAKLNSGDLHGARADLLRAEHFKPGAAQLSGLEEELDQKVMDLIIEEIKDGAKQYSYAELKANGAFLSGEKIRLRGKVAGMSDRSSVMFVNMTLKGNTWTDRVAVYYLGADEFMVGELIVVFGRIRGFYNFPSSSRSIPAIGAEYIK